MSSPYSSRSMFSNGEAIYQHQSLSDELVAALNPQQSVKLLALTSLKSATRLDGCDAF
jgi:hypothetical protein